MLNYEATYEKRPAPSDLYLAMESFFEDLSGRVEDEELHEYVLKLHMDFSRAEEFNQEVIKSHIGFRSKSKIYNPFETETPNALNWFLSPHKAEIIQNRSITCPSPYTGTICSTDKSIYLDYELFHGGICIFYYLFCDEAGNFFALIADSTTGNEIAIIAPKDLIVIKLHNSATGKSKFYTRFLSFLARYKRAVLRYVEKKSESLVHVSGVLNHWGHVMAQEVPANLHFSNLFLNKFDVFIEGKRKFYSINDLMDIDEDSVFSIINEEDIALKIMELNALAVRPTSSNFKFDDMCRRFIIKNSLEKSLCDFEDLQVKLHGHGPIVCIDLRVNKRVWLEQERGIIELIDAISDKDPNSFFIITGWTTGENNKGWTQDEDIIQEERNLASRIIEGVSRPSHVISVVGCNMPLKVSLAANLADFHISPWGSGVSYYWEIGDIPGIIHGNIHCIKKYRDRPLIASMNFLSKLTPQEFIDSQHITDFFDGEQIGEESGSQMRFDYSLKPCIVSDLAIKMIFEDHALSK